MGAIGGGAALIISPSGALMGMPLSVLENTPFNSFLYLELFYSQYLNLCPYC